MAEKVPQSAQERLDEYVPVKRLGTGRFGEAHLVLHQRLFCWKVVSYRNLKEREKQQLVDEVNVMQALRHPNIVQYVDCIVHRSSRSLYIIMEYCDAGDLAQNIQDAFVLYGGLDEERIVQVARQLLQALAYCHEPTQRGKPRTLHRDLKPQNIFLKRVAPGGALVVKLGDFGLSRTLGLESFAETCVGTPYYWAPELLCQGIRFYDEKSDIWALGCLTYEMAAGRTPFAAARSLEQLRAAVHRGARLPLAGKSPFLNALLAWLLHPCDTLRPSAQWLLTLTPFGGPRAPPLGHPAGRRSGRLAAVPEQLPDTLATLRRERERLRATHDRLFGSPTRRPSGDQNRTLRPQSRKPRTQSRTPRTQSRTPRTQSRKPRAQSREPPHRPSRSLSVH